MKRMIENDEYVGREAQEERLRTAVEQRVGRALSRQAAAGKIDADDYPMMMLVYRILTENRKAEMPWKAFRGK